MIEIWKDIKGYEGLYQVSNLGRVRSINREYVRSDGALIRQKGRIKKLSLGMNGYLAVSLYDKEKNQRANVHRLVAIAFLPNEDDKPCIDHINCDKTDNRVENLRWCTQKENMSNPITLERKRELVKRGPEHPNYGKPRSKEALEKFSKTMRNKVVSQEERERRSVWAKTCPKVRGAQHPRARSIAQYNRDGTLLKIWGSIVDAANFYGICVSSIKQNLRRISKTASGYVWKYVISKE